MERDEVLAFLSSHRQELAERFGVSSLSVFGSMARDEAGPESDVDLLVEFCETPGLGEYMRLKFWLEDQLRRPVDLVMEKALKPWARPVVGLRRSVSRSWELFLRDMLEAARKVIRFTADRQLESFVADEMAYDATLRNLEVLGEAAKGIPDDVRQRHPDVDWRGLAGLRDILAHAYFALDDPTLWKIVQIDIPRVIELLGPIEKELP